MAATTGTARAPFVPRTVDGDERVKPLELFFDLVFVFAITQVTGMLSEDPTWAGLARGLLVLGVLWWAWVAYAWLTNTVDPEEGFVRLAMFAAMAAMLVVSLAAPEAFDDEALLFGVGYFLVRALHIVLYAIASRGNPDLRGAVVRLALSMLGAALIIIVAGFTDGRLQGALWVAALVVDFGGVVVGGMEGWSVSPGHFAERHGLIVIIALGESIVAVGVGASGLDIDAGVVAATVLGVGVAAALWWAYFDVVAPVAERRCAARRGSSAPRWRATPTASCTSRWSPGSSSSPWGSRRPSATSTAISRRSLPSACAAGSPFTSSATSSSVCATCTPSTASGSSS